MYEVVWMQFNTAGELVTKRKGFESEAARERFVRKLFDRDDFHSILAYIG